jgi:membrane-bound lytic murein transglycosylase B
MDDTGHRKENPVNIAPIKQKPYFTKLMALFITLLALFFGIAETHAAVDDAFAPLKQKLVADGFGQTKISILYPSGFTPLYKTVSQTLHLRESKLNYDQFLQPSTIAEAKRFLRKNENVLLRAEEIYGVNRCVIVAILLVETHFGSYTGATPTFAILSTFALMDQKSSRDRVWNLMSPQDRRNWDRADFDRRLTQRANWAYDELYALLRLTEGNPKQIAALKGSVMGAIGWPQFLPSSLVRWGTDGNRDGRIDLFELEDAIFSVANYLRVHGWDEAGTEAEKEDVIYTYNHSRPYVGAILGVAGGLGECSGKDPVPRLAPKP